jgi:16S rRNA (guanine527-N7)-methyltransferase
MSGVPAIDAHWRERLRGRLAEAGHTLDAGAQERLLEYLALLVQWNAAYNLTAVRDPLQMIDRHLIDALSLLPHLAGDDLADIGTGPGVPGLVLALARPFARVWLVDSNGKKARFLRECLRRFDLPHVVVHEARAEALPGDVPFNQIVSRAYSELALFVRSTRQLLAPDGRWLAMKGKRPDAEIAALPAWAQVEAVHELKVPGADGERHLVVLRLTP